MLCVLCLLISHFYCRIASKNHGELSMKSKYYLASMALFLNRLSAVRGGDTSFCLETVDPTCPDGFCSHDVQISTQFPETCDAGSYYPFGGRCDQVFLSKLKTLLENEIPSGKIVMGGPSVECPDDIFSTEQDYCVLPGHDAWDGRVSLVYRPIDQTDALMKIKKILAEQCAQFTGHVDYPANYFFIISVSVILMCCLHCIFSSKNTPRSFAKRNRTIKSKNLGNLENSLLADGEKQIPAYGTSDHVEGDSRNPQEEVPSSDGSEVQNNSFANGIV
jgi:hypothetical protein